MVEGMVVKEQLTDSMIEAGAALTQKLDETGLPVTTALWFFDTEIAEWRLLFASREVRSPGPFSVYKRIDAALSELGERAAAAPMSVISIMGDDADLPRRLRMAIGTGPRIGRIRFRRNVAEGRFIEDALIYRAA